MQPQHWSKTVYVGAAPLMRMPHEPANSEQRSYSNRLILQMVGIVDAVVGAYGSKASAIQFRESNETITAHVGFIWAPAFNQDAVMLHSDALKSGLRALALPTIQPFSLSRCFVVGTVRQETNLAMIYLTHDWADVQSPACVLRSLLASAGLAPEEVAYNWESGISLAGDSWTVNPRLQELLRRELVAFNRTGKFDHSREIRSLLRSRTK